VTRAQLIVSALLLAAPLGLAADPDQAPPPLLDGVVTISGGVVALGIGYLWGHGTLQYQGRQLSFRIRGVDLGDVGAAHITAQGAVYRLQCVDDFNGRYVAVSTGAAVARGQSAAAMQNEHGVLIELESKIVGIRFNLSASRLRLTLDSHEGCTDDASGAQ
jgi:hypothetical protein